MKADPRDFPNEGKLFNRCVGCKCYFQGSFGRMYCRLCAPEEINVDQVSAGAPMGFIRAYKEKTT